MHRNFSLWHWRWDIPAATVASHVSGTSRPETTRTRREILNDWHWHIHTAGVQGDLQSHAHRLSIAIDCDVITHFPPSAALPLALLWPWSILFEVIIASTLLPTTENERVREWLRRMWGPQPPCPHILATTRTHTHELSRSTVTVDTHSCAVHLCSVHCQQRACHSYSPPSSGTVWETGPVHLVIPTGSFLFIMTGNFKSS